MIEFELNDIAEITSSKRIFYSDYVEEGIPFYRSREIINLDNGEDLKELIFITQEKYLDIKNKFGAPEKDDILITSVGTIGNTYIVRENDEFYFKDGNLTWLRNWKGRIEPKFVFYWLKSPIGQGKLYQQLIGSSQKALTIAALKKIKIEFPEDKTTQRKIASILSAYDDLIENNLKRIKLLEEKAFLRYKSEFDFFKPSNEINKIPEGWFVKRAEEIFKINIGKTPPREQSEWFNDDDSKVKWVSIKDINNSTVFAFETSETVTEMAVNKFNMNVAKAHTVLLSFKLTVGKVAITTEDMTTNEAIAHFNIEDENQMCSEYIYFYLKNFPYDSLGSTSSIGTAINSKVVKAMPVLLPPKKVINDYKKDVENDFNLIQNLLKQNTKLREARNILLPKLMNGQIEV